MYLQIIIFTEKFFFIKILIIAEIILDNNQYFEELFLNMLKICNLLSNRENNRAKWLENLF